LECFLIKKKVNKSYRAIDRKDGAYDVAFLEMLLAYFFRVLSFHSNQNLFLKKVINLLKNSNMLLKPRDFLHNTPKNKIT